MASTEANSINAATTGIVGNTGTSFTGTAVTQYNVVVGGSTSSTLANVAPSATSGVPLVSGGSSANPSFTTAVVAGGGTGDTSFTTYAPICGGTSTTGALQSASTGLSTSGFILTSTGGSSLPTFQAPAASSITITGDSGGGLTGNSFTFTGGTTGLTFSGATSTETLIGTLVIANGGTNATSFTQSNGIVTYNGTSLVNYAGPQINSSGVYTNSTQPCFLYALETNVTNASGNSGAYTLGSTQALTKIYDQGNNMTTGGTFTAPVTGKYMFFATMYWSNITVANEVQINFTATSRTLQVHNNIMSGQNGYITGSVIIDMSASNTLTFVGVTSGEAGNTNTLFGNAALTYVGGCLLC